MKKIIVILCFVLLLSGCNRKKDVIYINKNNEFADMKIHYINIKNGRCTFVELPNGECMLIDSGATTDFPIVYEYLRKHDVKNIDYMVISANDKYHLGGTIKILNNFLVHEMFVSKSIPDGKMYKNMAGEAIRNNCKISVAEGGSEIFSLDNINVSVVAPVHENYIDYEDFSLSVMISYGEVNCLIMANCTEKTEKDMLMTSGEYLKSTLISSPCNDKNALSSAFLQNISPRYAVIQVFDEKIPIKSTLNVMDILGIYVLRTDVNGNIVITTNSMEITNIHTQR